MTEIAEIIIRGIAAFMFLMVLSYLIGKQMVGQMGYHRFCSGDYVGVHSRKYCVQHKD